jgi:hypothetical protein
MRTALLPVLLFASVCSAAAQDTGLSIRDAAIVEGDAGARTIEVVLSLPGPATAPVTVAYATRDGSAGMGSDYQSATGTVSFAPGELVKRVAVSVVGDRAIEADETFEVVLSNASGAAIVDGTGTVTIVNDDNMGVAGPTVYEIRLTYTGFTGSLATAKDCQVRQNGFVVMAGLVGGAVNGVPADEDIELTGILYLDADIDLCEARPLARPDEFDLCTIRVVASGRLNTELSVYAADRGGYVKAEMTPGGLTATVTGSCDRPQMAEERAAFPDNSRANIFNGIDLPLPSGPLRVGRYMDGPIVVEVLRVVRP